MEKSESIKELAIALNKVQITIGAAKKDSVNPFFKSTYADLSSVWNACRETLTTNGLSVTQIADMDSEGRAVLETVLMHTSGEWIKGRLPLSTVKTDPQGQGSAITYARRYSLSAIIGLCTEEDDDAEAAMSRGKQKKESPKAPEPKLKAEIPTSSKAETLPPPASNIDMDWLNDALKTLKWDSVGAYIKGKYPKATGATLGEAIESLTREQQKEFVTEVQTRVEIQRNS